MKELTAIEGTEKAELKVDRTIAKELRPEKENT